MHSFGQVVEALDLRREFHERPGQRRQVGGKDRLLDEIFGVLLAGGDQDRRARHLRVVEHAHGVAEAGRDVEVEHRELAGGLRVAVGHRHQRGLLQAEDVADVVLDREGVHQRQFGGAGIAEHDPDALLLEQIEERAFTGHHGHGWSPVWWNGRVGRNAQTFSGRLPWEIPGVPGLSEMWECVQIHGAPTDGRISVTVERPLRSNF